MKKRSTSVSYKESSAVVLFGLIFNLVEVAQVRKFLWHLPYWCIPIFSFHWEASTQFPILDLN